jgi:N4-gp56 family major capsid protein
MALLFKETSMNIVTTSNFKPEVLVQAARNLLSTPTAKMIHKLPAQMYEMQARAGSTIRYRRINQLPPATVPVGNSGQNPPPVIPTMVDLDATPQLYGQYMYVNEQVVLQNEADVIENFSMRLGISMRLSEDRLMRDMLAASASSINAVGGNNGDNPTQISVSDVSAVTSTLITADALTVLDSIEGENRYGTAPVPNSFFALAHASLTKDLDALGNDFTRTIRYPSQTNILKAEYGSVGQLRFLISSQGSISKNASRLGRDVLNIFCVGIEAIACIYANEFSSQFIYLPKEFSGGLAQNITLGMKFFEAPRILNDLWIATLKVTPAV